MGHRNGARVAAEGGAVDAGHHAGGGLLGGEDGADRETATEALGERHDVGFDAGPLVSEQLAAAAHAALDLVEHRSEEHTSELQSLMRISYAVFCLKKKIKIHAK